MVDVLVLGATGFTGELIVKYLLEHPDRPKFTLGIAARSKSKLDELKQKLRIPGSVQTFYVDVTNQSEVDEVVQISKVVINAVGPYWRWGTPVVSACARHGKHYVDLTGEPHWIRDVIIHYDYQAFKSGAIIIPSAGFDSVPSDLSVHLSNKTLKALAGPDSEIEKSITAFKVSGTVSGGTLSTFFSSIEEVPRYKVKLAHRDWSLSTHIRGARRPPRKLFYTLPFSVPTVFGGVWFMAASNRAIVQRSWGLNQREAQSSNNREVQSRAYGRKFQYDEFLVTGGKFSAIVLSLGLAFGFACVLFSPIRWLLKKLVVQPGEGPSEQALQNGFMEITNVSSSADTASKPATHVRSIIRGRGDPGYGLAAVMIAESALSLALQYSDLPDLARKGGVLTPATALGDILVKRLEASGRISFESEVVLGEQVENRKTR